MSGTTILVTGGAGFIGSNVVASLAADPGAEVVVCDRLRTASSGKWRNLAKHAIADFVPPENLSAWLEGQRGQLDLIVHMGAISSTMESDADKVINTNFGLSRDLFRWSASNNVRFIYASSAATYGDGSAGFDDHQDLDGLKALRPLNAYGWSKALFDVFAVRQAMLGHAPPRWTGLKFFNVYGPNEGHKGDMRSVICKMWPTVASGGRVRLFRSDLPGVEDGGQQRDFVYVRDIADCVNWLARNGGVDGVFNLGSGKARTFADLARAVFTAAGRDVAIDYIDMPEGLRGAYQNFTEAKMERLRAAGWGQAATTLEDGVRDYVERYLSLPDAHR